MTPTESRPDPTFVPTPAQKRRWIHIFWGYCCVLLAISLSAYMGWLRVDLLTIPHIDTAMHFFLLGGASYLSHRALGGRRVSLGRLGVPLGPLLVGAVATTDECLQRFASTRTFSLLDLSANLAGVVVFGWLACYCVKNEW